MLWFILGFIFAVYVIFSLSTIKYQLRMIVRHLNINGELPRVSNEEIERELEESKQD